MVPLLPPHGVKDAIVAMHVCRFRPELFFGDVDISHVLEFVESCLCMVRVPLFSIRNVGTHEMLSRRVPDA